MAVTTALVRMRLNDNWRHGEETHFGDGTASAFKLAEGYPHSTIISATASIPVAVGWSATGATFDTAVGRVVFPTAISANSAIHVNYLWALFGEQEMAHFTAQSTLDEATLEGVRVLMGNAWKRAKWAAPDGSEYDDKEAMRNLALWRSALKADIEEAEVAGDGGFVSWGVNQENY